MEKETVGGTAKPNTKKTPTGSAGVGTGKGNIMDTLKASTLQVSNMDEAATQHLENLINMMNSQENGIVCDRVPFRNCEAVLLFHKDTNNGIILVYDSGTYSAPLMSNRADILKTVKMKYPNVMVNQMVAVPDIDYHCLPTLAKRIYNNLIVSRNDWLSLDQFSNTMMVHTNRPGVIAKARAQLSPHAVAARCDYGDAVFVCGSREIPRDPVTGRVDYDHEDMVPLLVISGYNRFIKVTDDPVPRYVVVATISEIASNLSDPGLLGLALPLAIHRWTKPMNDWLLPYRYYTENAPNLGALYMKHDDKGKAYCDLVENDHERQQFLAGHIADLWVGIDIPDGRWRLPLLERFNGMSCTPDEHNVLRRAIARYIKVDPNTMPPLCHYAMPQTYGYIEGNIDKASNSSGSYFDSRMVDYLNVYAASGGKQNPETLQFLHFAAGKLGDKELRDYIDRTFLNYLELFPGNMVILNPDGVNFISQNVKNLNIMSDCEQSDTGAFQDSMASIFGITPSSMSRFNSGGFGRASANTPGGQVVTYD